MAWRSLSTCHVRVSERVFLWRVLACAGFVGSIGATRAEQNAQVSGNSSLPIVTRSQMAEFSDLTSALESMEPKKLVDLSGGLGMEVFQTDSGKSESFMTLNLSPEFRLWKIGVGLGAPLRVNLQEGNIRNEDWDEPSDYIKIFRYVHFPADEPAGLQIERLH